MNQCITYQPSMFDYSITVFLTEKGTEEQTRIGTIYETVKGFDAVNLRGERYSGQTQEQCADFLYRSRRRSKGNTANPNQKKLF